MIKLCHWSLEFLLARKSFRIEVVEWNVAFLIYYCSSWFVFVLSDEDLMDKALGAKNGNQHNMRKY